MYDTEIPRPHLWRPNGQITAARRDYWVLNVSGYLEQPVSEKRARWDCELDTRPPCGRSAV